jgi:transcription antitermination factor NusA-like protein
MRSAGSRVIEKLEEELREKVKVLASRALSCRFIILLIPPRIQIQVNKLENKLNNIPIYVYVMRCLKA